MKKVKFKEVNVHYKPRKNGNTYYYKVYNNGDYKYYRIGSDRDTVALLKANYETIRSRLWAEANGFAPAIQVDTEPVVNQVLFKDIYSKFVTDVEDNHGFSWKRDLFNFKSFVEYFGQDGDWIGGTPGVAKTCEIDLATIGHKDLEGYFKSEAKLHSKSTVNCRHKYIRPLYKWLCREGYLEVNHYDNHDRLNLKNDSISYQALTREQIEQIISLTKIHEHKVLWTIMAYTGLAPKDAGSLNKLDSLVSNGEFECIVTKRSKTKVTAQIPILGDLAKLGDLIWTLNLTKKQRDDANTEFVKLAKQVGVKPRKGFKISQYGLRHSLATLLKPHLTDNELALVLGHTNTKQQLTYVSSESIEIHRKIANVLK